METLRLSHSVNYHLTGAGVVNTLITDLAVLKFEDGVMKLIELQPGTTLEQVEASTEAHFENELK